ncbi:MAG: sulfatase-like hydrolase/transferase [Pseudomonadota bacterium]
MQRPNFLLFITDQQRADHTGAYGNTVVHTPNIDALAGRGWLAEKCYVASPICMPNRGSLMTGRLPSIHGARHNGIPLPFSEVTFVERLRDSGYATALVGKSHLQNISGHGPSWPRATDPVTSGEARKPEPGRTDQEWGPAWEQDPSFDMSLPFYGFEKVRLVINHGDTAGGHYRRWLEKEHPEAAKLTGPANAIPTPDYALSAFQQAWRTRVPEELSTTSFVGSETSQLIEQFAKEDKPFFIQCSFPDPHHPFTPPGRFWDMHDPDDMQLPDSFHSEVTGPAPHLEWMHEQRNKGKAVKHTPAMFAATERETREALALNYGSIAHIDETIGRVLAQLEKLGIADNTVVLFTSDHGDFFGDHQLLWKGPLHYQGVTRVPLIWADPQAGAGKITNLCSTIDIAPTILERAGCVLHNGIQGLSLLPVMASGAALPRDEILIEEEGQRTMFGFPGRTKMRTLQTSRYRLSVFEGADWGELYDLESDPTESRNLWEEPSAAAIRSDLLHRMAKSMIHYADPSPHPTALA